MIYFNVNLSNGNSVRIDETELKAVMQAIARRDGVTICKRGAFNPSFFVNVIVAEELPDTVEIVKQLPNGKIALVKAKREEPASPFAKALAQKLPQLSAESRTKAQEEAAREDRKLKSN